MTHVLQNCPRNIFRSRIQLRSSESRQWAGQLCIARNPEDRWDQRASQGPDNDSLCIKTFPTICKIRERITPWVFHTLFHGCRHCTVFLRLWTPGVHKVKHGVIIPPFCVALRSHPGMQTIIARGVYGWKKQFTDTTVSEGIFDSNYDSWIWAVYTEKWQEQRLGQYSSIMSQPYLKWSWCNPLSSRNWSSTTYVFVIVCYLMHFLPLNAVFSPETSNLNRYWEYRETLQCIASNPSNLLYSDLACGSINPWLLLWLGS